MIRALVYGRPQNLEQLNKYLFKGTRGLWEHQMITKAEVTHFQFGNSIKWLLDYWNMWENIHKRDSV